MNLVRDAINTEINDQKRLCKAQSQKKDETLRQNVEFVVEMEDVKDEKREAGGVLEVEETVEKNEYDITAVEELGEEDLTEKLKYWTTVKMEEEEKSGISSEDTSITQNVKPKDDAEVEEEVEENVHNITAVLE